MSTIYDDTFGFERGPEHGGEQDVVARFVEGYHALGQVEPQTFDTVSNDLLERVDRGELTEDQAIDVLRDLGFFNDVT